MKKTLIFLISILTLISCNGQKKDTKAGNNKINNNLVINSTMVQNVLKKQLECGYSISNDVTDIGYYQFEKSDLLASIQIANQLLSQQGYKKLSQLEFTNKVQTIFGDLKKFDNILFLSKTDKCLKPNNIEYYDSDGFLLNIYFDIESQLIIEQYKLPELIDYQKEYPELAKLENNIQTKKVDKNGDNLYITRWRDVEDLLQQRYFNQQLLINRNKYLFNDNKASLAWLKFNDQDFLESLVKTFGYTQEKDLLRWVIERTKFDKDNLEDFGKLFWTKDCNLKVRLHANTFKLLQELYKPNDKSEMRFLLDNIQYYIEYIGLKEIDKEKNIGISDTDRVRILANMAYFAEQYKYKSEFQNDSNRMMGRLRYILWEKDVEILEQNNYFNLPKFKEWWDKAKYDEDFVMECEYEGTCGKDNPQPDAN